MFNLFKKTFTVVEYKGGKTYETHLVGTKEEIEKDIQAFKTIHEGCEMKENSKKLVIWVD